MVKEVVMSDARRRKSAVWAMAENGVVSFWVDRKLVSQIGDGERNLVEVSCADTWAASAVGWEAMEPTSE